MATFPPAETATRLGLYGGSFDPVHLGHLLVAQAAREELNLDRLIFIPAAQSPFKPGSAPTDGALRTRLLRLALAGLPWASIDTLELERGGVSYSVDTAAEFSRRHPGQRLFWLIGADHVASLPLWREAARLSALVEFVVIPRPGAEVGTLPEGFRFCFLKGFPLSVSSSGIRERVRAGRSAAPLVPAAVAEAIEAHGLYRS